MFFITTNGVKEWKKGDDWYKPKIVEGYNAYNEGSGKIIMILLSILAAVVVLYVLYFLYKRKDDK